MSTQPGPQKKVFKKDIAEQGIIFLQRAIEKAKESVVQGGFPAGAVMVKNGEIISEGVSIGNKLHDPTSHGEVAAVRDACNRMATSDLSETTLYASMQPCLMCFAAAMWAGVPRVVFAVRQEKVSSEYYGGTYQLCEINKNLNHPIDTQHVAALEEESLQIVTDWEKLLQ